MAILCIIYYAIIYNNNIHLFLYNNFTLSSHSRLKASSDLPFYMNKTQILNSIMMYPLPTFSILSYFHSFLCTLCFSLGGILSLLWACQVLCCLTMFLLLGNFFPPCFMCLSSSCPSVLVLGSTLERTSSPRNFI